jgi:site-specific DNA-methyltransferase (adenine-specific)
VVILQGDCIAVMRDILDDNTVDAIVTDPPYELGFMGKTWDKRGVAFDPATWAECLRVLKPGGHLLSFGGARTWHRLAVAVEDAGFEIRDSIAWLYGQGFPKSLDVGKAIDKAARGVPQGGSDPTSPNHGKYRTTTTEGKRWEGDSGQGYGAGGSRFLADGQASGSATALAGSGAADNAADARKWQGWGTALKPAHEPIMVARKPLCGTVAANVLQHGTGALNINACRIETDEDRTRPPRTPNALYGNGAGTNLTASASHPAGRWPANVALDEGQAAALDEQSGNRKSGWRDTDISTDVGGGSFSTRKTAGTGSHYGDQGGASRFMYVAKAPKSERPVVNGISHATVKPLTLMRWLVRLVTPPGGAVLDPFAGSGTTIEAAMLEGFDVIGIEREATYLPLIDARIARARAALACKVHDIQQCTICLPAAS